MRVRDSSATQIFFKKKKDDATSGSETNQQMDYQLAATKNFCANVGPRIKKRFLNPPIGDMPITEENGRVTVGGS